MHAIAPEVASNPPGRIATEAARQYRQRFPFCAWIVLPVRPSNTLRSSRMRARLRSVLYHLA
jgi:hypothetical protein